MDVIAKLIATLRTAQPAERSEIKNQLLDLARAENGTEVREYLDSIKRGELLEIQWEIDDVLDESAPVAAEPVESPTPDEDEKADETNDEKSPEEADPDAPLTAADLNLVYDDPRGFMLHKSKVGQRWFATQMDPRTGQPQTFELHAHEIDQIKGQLQGSPYWRIGG